MSQFHYKDNPKHDPREEKPEAEGEKSSGGVGQTPIAGYTNPSEEMIELVNGFKALEAAIGAHWRKVKASGLADPRMLAEGKTAIQDGMMWLNRAIFKPKDVFDQE